MIIDYYMELTVVDPELVNIVYRENDISGSQTKETILYSKISVDK
jgi:hypothetical protein